MTGYGADKRECKTACLLPNFDEYVVGYTDRSAILDSSRADHLDARNNPLFQHTIIIDGEIAGTWKRAAGKEAVTIETLPFGRLGRVQERAVELAARRLGEFLELPVARV